MPLLLQTPLKHWLLTQGLYHLSSRSRNKSSWRQPGTEEVAVGGCLLLCLLQPLLLLLLLRMLQLQRQVMMA